MPGRATLGSRPPEDSFEATACSVHTDLYLHPLIEDPPAAAAPGDLRQTYAELVGAARAFCAACPLLVDCLYKAVVHTDVSGYVGCTTARERETIRSLLGVRVDADEMDAFAGTRGARQPVDHDDVLRMRAAHPEDSLEVLATRLDCSLSTVKRHLRRARDEATAGSLGGASPLPTVEDVLDAFDEATLASQQAQP